MYRKSIALIICLLTVVALAAQSENQNFQLQKLNQSIYAISTLYVDSVNNEKLVEDAIEGILKQLDPHSTYIPAKEVARMNESVEGSFEGIGIQFQMLNDTLFVIQTISGCPAAKVGVLPGDRIVSVGGKIIAGVKMPQSDIMKLIRGKRGTEVVVQVKRADSKALIDFVIVRDRIPVYSLDAAYMITPTIGYIKLNSFSATTFKEFRQAIIVLKQSGMKQLLLDLQGNGGGLLQAAIDLVDQFLEKGETIVYTEGINNPKNIARATAVTPLAKTDVVVLVDEYSASASEIVSGALQDWDRAIIVGRRTFGKGLVQRPVPLLDGSLIRLTVARYYTPSGRNIQKPYNEGVEQYQQDLIHRYNHGELQCADSITFPDSLRYKTLRLGRTVYGGGGIMPDIFMPLDTNRFTLYHRNLVAKGVVNKTLVQYVEKNRKNLEVTYGTFEKFNAEFVLNDSIFETLIANGEAAKVSYNETEFKQSKQLIAMQLKALIARDIWTNADYFKVMNSEDDIVQKGIEVLTNYKQYWQRLEKK